ncbi:uncharacterized protein LOC118187557, partial [Stegodyphus dumicola]|uniref:uncharacterized protein LOC118187557 n=1 Tax=Stegodyphus dumicola TaxID=202533 RepID=UPI0015AC0CDC
MRRYARNDIMFPAAVLFSSVIVNTAFAIEETIAIQGQAGFIPCHAFQFLKSPQAKPVLLRWFHSRHYKPIYTLDVRFIDSSTSTEVWGSGRHFPSPEGEGRMYLDVNSNPMVLRIDPVLYEDSGVYTCRLDFKSQRSVFATVVLKVI